MSSASRHFRYLQQGSRSPPCITPCSASNNASPKTSPPKQAQVQAAIELLDDGATVPFIARYRKEATGGLDDTQLRLLEERLRYLRELEDRRAAILASIDEQGKLTTPCASRSKAPTPRRAWKTCTCPTSPSAAPRRRSRARPDWSRWPRRCSRIPRVAPETRAEAFVDADKGVADVKAALDGARAILMERSAEDAALVGELRDWLWDGGRIRARVYRRQGERGRQVPRLLRPQRSHREDSLAPRCWRCCARATRASSNWSWSRRAPTPPRATPTPRRAWPGHAGIAQRGRPGDAWLADTVRLDLDARSCTCT